MSILINEAYANDTTPLWASSSGGGGGGYYIPMTNVVIPPENTLAFVDPLVSGGSETIFTDTITLPDGLYQFSLDLIVSGTLSGSPTGYFIIFILYLDNTGVQYLSFLRDFAIGGGTLVYPIRVNVPIRDSVANEGGFGIQLINSSGVDLTDYSRVVANYSKILLTTDFTYTPPPP